MLFLALLLAGYGLSFLLPSRAVPEPADRWRLALAWAVAIAGGTHLADPTPFVQHLPAWVPAREPLVLVTGVAEIVLGGGLLLPPPHRRLAGTVLALYLVAVFPANVYVAVAGVEVDGQPGGLYPWLRLAFQPLFVWLALWSTRTPAAGPRPAAAAEVSGSR